ncbi:DEAD/DEAH box helicase [Flammeovirga yaeyamensis]|uniref:DEAD-box ATP-dependent RNA helicase RhpA n=1 Tax=Flammeovirga yaeyamensis TaxID=367791 RepID=A0AAX1NFX2_9BACT|nr:DEAD/DEAH box helicase [Flammeovirga yaeyamensis]MBB3696786.1 ATP-dependent RNA helicase RhlE [Flammeovirga yaeyamensis]NMF33452.1 DEAD/DEAH box helicase [Flammeovirga yaeyamensis]QWG05273.1 DEAD/DEAH box helicase [Flammeovirga yaeyamensis]
MTFKELKLNPSILKALNEEKYIKPTPIQAKAIPFVLKREDVLGCAQTGTGKTAAFAIPILQLMQQDKKSKSSNKITALVLTPTRELAIQIEESFSTYGKYTDVQNTVIFGGVNQERQVRALRKGVDVLIATPGRLLDLIGQGFINLSDIKYFVLDEADRMLDMGFIHDIKKVLKLLPKKRQSLFFSATMPKNIVSLSKQILINPKSVTVTPVSSTAETIQQFVYYTNKKEKIDLLHHLIKEKKIQQVLVFTRTKYGADGIVRKLTKKGTKCAAIHGNKSQNQRQKALAAFKDGSINVLVATDIAARGIDIDKLQYVINYDIPNESETYVHRIGRCGRAGEKGISISLSEAEDNKYIKDVEKLTKQTLTVVEEHPYPQTDKPMNATQKKAMEKEKQKRKQEFFANKKRKAAGNAKKEGEKKKPSRNRNTGKPKTTTSNKKGGFKGKFKSNRRKSN